VLVLSKPGLLVSAGAAWGCVRRGVSAGLAAPVPVFPDAGLAGGLLPEPEVPPTGDPGSGDPFAPGSQATVLGSSGVV
jgi:hypothetical protein